MNPLYQADYRSKGGKPKAIEYLDDATRHTKNYLAVQKKARMPKMMRSIIGVLMSMWGRAAYAGEVVIAPGMDAIAERAGCSIRTAQAHFKALIEAGVVCIVSARRGHGARTVFEVDLGALLEVFRLLGYTASRSLEEKLNILRETRTFMRAKKVIRRRKSTPKPEPEASEGGEIYPAIYPAIFASPYIEDINTVRSAPSERTGGEVSPKPSTSRKPAKGLLASLYAQYDRIVGSMGQEDPTREEISRFAPTPATIPVSAWGSVR